MATYELAKPFIKKFYNDNTLDSILPFEEFEEKFKENIDKIDTEFDIKRIGLKTIKKLRILGLIKINCPHCNHPNLFMENDIMTDGDWNYENCVSCNREFLFYSINTFHVEKL